MYAWIWRHIPFRRWQYKSLVSLVLVGAVGALLWYQVFPAVEPILPFDDVQVETTDPGAIPAEDPANQPRPSSNATSTVPAKAPTKAPTKAPSSAPPVVLPS